MSAFIDTNIVIRHLTGEPPDLAARATAIINEAQHLIITDVVISEVAYVLVRRQQLSRQRVVDALIDFIGDPKIEIFALDKPIVLEALFLCRPSGRVSFADALIWAAARCRGVPVVYTFDERFPSGPVMVLHDATTPPGDS